MAQNRVRIDFTAIFSQYDDKVAFSVFVQNKGIFARFQGILRGARALRGASANLGLELA